MNLNVQLARLAKRFPSPYELQLDVGHNHFVALDALEFLEQENYVTIVENGSEPEGMTMRVIAKSMLELKIRSIFNPEKATAKQIADRSRDCAPPFVCSHFEP